MAQRAARHSTSEHEANGEAAFDELLWEFDVTRRRADLDADRTVATRRPATFARPELRTRWQRFRGMLGVRILSWVLLVGGTGTLVALAVVQR